MIDEFGIAFRSFFPDSVKDCLLKMDRKNLFDVLDRLAIGLDLAYCLVHRNLRSHVIDFRLIENRLLRAVKIANIYNQNRKLYNPYDASIGMIIGDEIEASYKEKHRKKSLEVNEEIVEDILKRYDISHMD